MNQQLYNISKYIIKSNKPIHKNIIKSNKPKHKNIIKYLTLEEYNKNVNKYTQPHTIIIIKDYLNDKNQHKL